MLVSFLQSERLFRYEQQSQASCRAHRTGFAQRTPFEGVMPFSRACETLHDKYRAPAVQRGPALATGPATPREYDPSATFNGPAESARLH
jgi:hypothetical protein